MSKHQKDHHVYALNYKGMVKRLFTGCHQGCVQFTNEHPIPKGRDGKGEFTMKISSLSQKQAERELRL